MSSAGVVEKIHKSLAFVVNIGYSIARHDGPSWLGYLVTPWECTRAKRIEEIQGNPNPFVKEPCIEQGLYE